MTYNAITLLNAELVWISPEGRHSVPWFQRAKPPPDRTYINGARSIFVIAPARGQPRLTSLVSYSR